MTSNHDDAELAAFMRKAVTPESVEALVERLLTDHHRLCDSHKGKACDCYAATKSAHRLARHAAQLAERVKAAERRVAKLEGDLDVSIQTGKLLVEQREAAERERDYVQRERAECATAYALAAKRAHDAEAQRDELVEALERILGDYHSYEHAHKLARTALAKVRGEAGNMGGVLHQEQADHLRRAQTEPPGWGADRKCPETCG